jgi:uncharacterized protein YfbU (UPF0304 family)
LWIQDGESTWRIKVTLTPFERQMLIELKEIRQLLSNNLESERTIEALQNGYVDYYGLNYLDDELSGEDARFVVDVFQMYLRIQDAFKTAGAEIPDFANCRGFDGNNQSALFGYAQFLIDNGLWVHLGVAGDFPNSHGTQPAYREMLSECRRFLENRVGAELSTEEAESILNLGRRGG